MTTRSTDVRAIYHEDYFLKQVDGYDQFKTFDGSFKTLFDRYKRNIELVGLRPTDALLEIGCGRGEICIFHALQGGSAKGIDYSTDAIMLAKEKAAQIGANAQFVAQPFDEISDEDGTYDKIIASEFIEHISEEEGRAFIRIAFRLLKPGGRVLVHTFPNTMQRRFGYPLLRAFGALRNRPLPPVQIDTVSEHFALYHLNEQSYFSLRALAVAGGFESFHVGYDDLRHEGFRGMVMRTPLRHLFGTNLFLLAEK